MCALKNDLIKEGEGQVVEVAHRTPGLRQIVMEIHIGITTPVVARAQMGGLADEGHSPLEA
jgi:hypothetical protein